MEAPRVSSSEPIEHKRSRLWRWGVSILSVTAVVQYFYSEAHPPVGVYVVILGLAAAAVTLMENLDKWEKAAWIILMFSLGALEISNLYRDRNKHDAEVMEARKEQNDNFAKDVNQITGGQSYAVVVPLLVGSKEHPLCRLAVFPGNNRERYTLYNVRLSVRALPIPNEGTASQFSDLLLGRNQPLVWNGEIDPETFELLPPNMKIDLPETGTRSYVANVFARNKPTTETLSVRFNAQSQRWEYSFKIIRELKSGGPEKPDITETLESSNPEWRSTTFIKAAPR
jgi:hypothetical protein